MRAVWMCGSFVSTLDTFQQLGNTSRRFWDRAFLYITRCSRKMRPRGTILVNCCSWGRIKEAMIVILYRSKELGLAPAPYPRRPLIHPTFL